MKKKKQEKLKNTPREYPTLRGKDAEIFIDRQKNYMNDLLKKYGRNK